MEYGFWAPAGAAPDQRTLFEIGSITKAFTGVLLADMVLRGELALDDPLSRHLDSPRPAWRDREPTLLELATHRSGVPNDPGPARAPGAAVRARDRRPRPVGGRRCGALRRAPREHAPPPRAGRAHALLEHRLRPPGRRARRGCRGTSYAELLRERAARPARDGPDRARGNRCDPGPLVAREAAPTARGPDARRRQHPLERRRHGDLPASVPLARGRAARPRAPASRRSRPSA